MYLAAAVGGYRVGMAALHASGAVGIKLMVRILLVLRVLEVTVSEYLGLLVTGVCSHKRSAFCVSSSSQLQWSHGERKQGKQRGQ